MKNIIWDWALNILTRNGLIPYIIERKEAQNMNLVLKSKI